MYLSILGPQILLHRSYFLRSRTICQVTYPLHDPFSKQTKYKLKNSSSKDIRYIYIYIFTYIYTYIYEYIYIYIYIYTNLPVNAIVGLPHPARARKQYICFIYIVYINNIYVKNKTFIIHELLFGFFQTFEDSINQRKVKKAQI